MNTAGLNLWIALALALIVVIASVASPSTSSD